MDHVARLAAHSIPAFVLVLFVSQIVAREFGLFLGQRRADRVSSPESVGVIVGAMLGLLAFVLALTLSSSTTRFQERRQAILDEASAIGSAWSRAEAMGDPRGDRIGRLMADYTRVRIEFVEAPADAGRLAEIGGRSAALQAQMQGLAAEIARSRPDPLSVSLLNELDAAFGAATTVQFAFSTRMMPQLFWLLIGMTFTAVVGLGYQIGLRGQTLRGLSLLVIGMWTAVITEILDLGTARIGDIGNDTGVYQWVLDDLAGETPPSDGSGRDREAA